MTRRSATRLLENTRGAVAPTVALSLFGLIAAGGIAFDYARMASMDTELQSAADHAALAAATQLDGRTGACDRARAAAVGMVSNQTLMANDGNGVAVTVTQGSGCAANSTDGVRLYQDINHTTAATDDSNAKFVMVVVDSRTANYALTPVVGALSSGAISATAFAGLNQAICKVPPVMFCNPKESTDPDFTVANYIGDGMRLISNDGGGSYGPGNFGFLATNAGNGASVLGKELGSSTVPGDCVQETGVTTDPDKIGFVAAFADDGGLRGTSPDHNVLTIAFAADAESSSTSSLEDSFRTHAPASLRPHMGDIMSVNRNAVIVWTISPSSDDSDAINRCLRS